MAPTAERLAEGEDRRRVTAANRPGCAQQSGEDRGFAGVVGFDDCAVWAKVWGPGVGPADEGSQEDDLAMAESVEVAAVDEVLRVPVAVVVVDVHADAREPCGGEEEVEFGDIEAVDFTGSLKEGGC